MRKFLFLLSILCLSTPAVAQMAPPASLARHGGGYGNPGYGNPYGGNYYGNPYGYYGPNNGYVGGHRHHPQILVAPPEPGLMQYPLYYQYPYQAPGLSPDGQVLYLPQ